MHASSSWGSKDEDEDVSCILEISGVRTKRGVIPADAIVMANGFRTNEFVAPMQVIGSDGKSLTDHWNQRGGPEAYNCSVMNGFPNFFMILGPNAATGHTSAVMASENTINYAMRVLKPLFHGLAESVEVKSNAEIAYVNKMQHDLRHTVWNSGCDSWYVRSKQKNGLTWNSMSYPYSQAHFWYRSMFPIWKDWINQICSSESTCSPCRISADSKRARSRLTLLTLMIGILCAVITISNAPRIPQSPLIVSMAGNNSLIAVLNGFKGSVAKP